MIMGPNQKIENWGRVLQSHIWLVGFIPLAPLAPRHHRHIPFPDSCLVRDWLGRPCSAGSLADPSSAFQSATSPLMDSSDRG